MVAVINRELRQASSRRRPGPTAASGTDWLSEHAGIAVLARHAVFLLLVVGPGLRRDDGRVGWFSQRRAARAETG